jgi:hypothetical protein
VVEAPGRELRAGDRLVFGAGIGDRLKVVFQMQDAVPPRRLAIHIRLPLGVTNHEVIEIAPVGANACRVTFNRAFEFPPGWRGRLIQTVLGRLFVTGRSAALARLKQAAEHR